MNNLQDLQIEETRAHLYCLKKYSGSAEDLNLCNEFCHKLSIIADKAFLSCKSIKNLVLPGTITEIGNWAFAHMKNLNSITLPSESISMGKDIFLDCPSLHAIFLHDDTSDNAGTPFLLASVITKLHAPSLLQFEFAGKSATHKQWLKEYDQSLISFLSTPNDQGFQPVFYGWFEDQDADVSQRPAYIKQKQMDKNELVFLRLSYPQYLSDPVRKTLEDFLSAQMPDDSHFYQGKSPTDFVLWNLYKSKYLFSIPHLHILINAQCFHSCNIEYFIQDLKDTNPEVTAILLNYMQKICSPASILEEFQL